MNAIKKLMAVSVIAAAGTANAASVAYFYGGTITPSITNIDYSEIPPTEIELVYSHSGSAWAVLDDTGTFTITSTVTFKTTVGTNTTMNMVEALTGTWDGATFTAAGGTHTYVNCVDNPDAPVQSCGNVFTVGVAAPADTLGSITLGGGVLSIAQIDPASGAIMTYTYTFDGVPPPIPVPGAALLFGSGLLGVAGTTSRRKK